MNVESRAFIFPGNSFRYTTMKTHLRAAEIERKTHQLVRQPAELSKRNHKSPAQNFRCLTPSLTKNISHVGIVDWHHPNKWNHVTTDQLQSRTWNHPAISRHMWSIHVQNSTVWDCAETNEKYSTKNVEEKKWASNEKRKETRKTTHQMVQVPNAYLTHPIGKKREQYFLCATFFYFLET